ncbi:MAG TPA: hypothetical protein VFU05_04695 [Cyclobacteriaceae bacterium]|nr:hypothetical protein [Cyclobacteriaceae bacterium]
MKKLLYLLLLVGLSSCEFYYLEPRISERDRIIGQYEIEEYSETYNDYTHYTIWIDKSTTYSNQIYIDNFYGSDLRVRASISYDKITIQRQVVNGFEIEGVGTVYGNEIQFSYSVRDIYSGTRTDFCEATAW